MSMPIMLIAVNADTFSRLKDNFKKTFDADGNFTGYVQNDLTDAQRKKMRSNFQEHWTTPTLGGTVYHIIQFQISNNVDENGKLVWVEWLLNKWPNKFVLIGVWNRDGTQFGTTRVPAVYDYTYPENPVLVTPETIDGTPVYPIPAQATPDRIMPPDVTYNPDGSVASSTPATEYKEVHTIFDYGKRVWV